MGFFQQPAEVVITNLQTSLELDEEWLSGIAVRALTLRRMPLRLSIALVEDRRLKEVHRDFLDDDRPTDVMAFDFRGEKSSSQPPGFDAELVISAEMAKREAEKREGDPRYELALYLIHGILHLDGFKDSLPQERAKMRSAEKELCSGLGIPYAF